MKEIENSKGKCNHIDSVEIGHILTPEYKLKKLYICKICKETLIKEKNKLVKITPRYF